MSGEEESIKIERKDPDLINSSLPEISEILYSKP